MKYLTLGIITSVGLRLESIEHLIMKYFWKLLDSRQKIKTKT